jgi:hypothetical protein
MKVMCHSSEILGFSEGWRFSIANVLCHSLMAALLIQCASNVWSNDTL